MICRAAAQYPKCIHWLLKIVDKSKGNPQRKVDEYINNILHNESIECLLDFKERYNNEVGLESRC
jgi:hypothetical protein